MGQTKDGRAPTTGARFFVSRMSFERARIDARSVACLACVSIAVSPLIDCFREHVMRTAIYGKRITSVVPLSLTAFLFVAANMFSICNSSAATLKTLHAFEFCNTGACADGSTPYGNLVGDSAGNLYGTTAGGGANAQGTVFELSPDGHGGWTYKIIYNFCSEADCEDGADPQATLIIDTNGTLYGTTQAPEAGKAFRLTPTGGNWELVPIHEFCGEEEGEDCIGGSNPSGGLTYAGAETGAPYDGVSALYGAAMEGGEGEAGVIYQLKPPHRDVEDWRVKELYVFCPAGGALARSAKPARKKWIRCRASSATPSTSCCRSPSNA